MRLRSRVSAGLAVAATGLVAAAIIVPRVGPTGNAAAAVTATQATAASVVRYTPYPTTGTDLYVDNATADCSDSGSGTGSQPFCTIAAAASVVQPGQTVVVEPGLYTGSVTISAQGSAQAPITFDDIAGAGVNGTSSAPVFTISGAHNVVLDGSTCPRASGSDPSTSPVARRGSPSTAAPRRTAIRSRQSKWTARQATSRLAG